MNSELTDIQRFYRNSTVLLTGSTGFVGKLILEKVLRSLPVKKVYVLIRKKKNSSAAERLNTIFVSPVFDILKRTNPDFQSKVEIIEGDLNLPFLGITQNDIELIIKEVDVIFHAAANVNFDAEMKISIKNNIASSKDLVNIAAKIQNLKVFVYIGTAYSNSNHSEIKEEIYPSKITAESLISMSEYLDDESFAAMSKTLTEDWPNKYTFTKQVTEEYLGRMSQNMPICIVRPAIVISTHEEPVSAFCDNVFTLAGLCLINGMGICRIAYDKPINLDVFPADFLVNECIAAGWHTGEIYKRNWNNAPVFNLTATQDNPLPIDDIYKLAFKYLSSVAITYSKFYPISFRTTCYYNYIIMRFFLHTLVGWIIDFALKVQGKEPVLSKAMKKVHRMQELYHPFTTKSYHMHTDNTWKLWKKMSVQDRKLFNFDITVINWNDYFRSYVKGLRVYLVKDPMDTLPEGQRHLKKLKKQFIIFSICYLIALYFTAKVLIFKIIPLSYAILMYFFQGMVC